MMRRSNTAIQNIANNNNNNNSNNVTPINTPLRGGNVSGGSCGSSGGCSGYGGGNSGEGKEKYYAHKRNFQTKLNEMDQTDSDCDGVGYRSPCVSLQQYHGSTSPAGQGRSVREFEEQMATLRKENFNLKLRLYFIEESIPGYHQGNAADGQEAFSKQLIEAKVEMEMLRKEIQEKQEILKEAAQAMNQMEKIQKDTETKSQAMVDELKQKIQYLEMEREMKPNSGDLMNNLLGFSNISENMNALQRMRELEGMVRQSDDRINEFQNQLSKMDEMLSKRDETIKEYEDKVKELVFQNAELLESLENKDKEVANAESQRLRAELQERKTELADKTCQLQDAEEQLQSRIQIHEQACRTIQKLMANIKSQQDEIDRLKSAKQQQKLAANISAPQMSGNTTATTTAEQHNNKERSEGNVDFTCTGLCRSMSDTEAFGELAHVSQRQKLEAVVKQQEATIENIKSENKKLTTNLQKLVNKELWEKNREIERLNKLLNNKQLNATSPTTPPPPAQEPVVSESQQLQQSFTDAEYARALERNKLLQRKVDILIQRLSAERSNEALTLQLRSDLRDALADAERAEKWRHECADVCSVLSKRLEELAGFLNSLLQHKDVLGVLAIDRRRAMRKAVDRSLDLSKSLNRTLSISGISLGEQSLAQLSNLSEILGDYECDEPSAHQQTLETLQAENQALKKELDKRRSTTEDKKKERRSLTHMIQYSESDSWSEPDRKVSMARMGLVEEPRNSGAAAAAATTSTAAAAATNTSFVEKKLFQELLQEFGETQEQLKREQAANVQLKECNASLQADLMAIGGVMDSSNNPVKLADLAFEQQLADQTHALQQLRDAHERLQMEARCAELQIGALQSELAEQQQAKKLAQDATEQLRNETTQKMATQQRLHAEELSRDWIERTVYEQTRQQLVDLQRQCLELERQVDTLHECETELKQTLMEQVQALRGCEKKLDESTLQASKAVTERTKALNEKLVMEKKLQKLQAERETLRTQLTQLQRQLAQHKCQNNMQNNNKNQNNTKANSLQIKHVGGGGGDSQSGYTSEEVILPSGVPGAVTAMATSVQRHNNSSPDLGIESDAGRVSSVELTNASHGQLKTVELAGSNIKEELSDGAEENMQPLTDTANNNNNNNLNNAASSSGVVTTTTITTTASAAATTNINHDCAKVEQENAELRRKLIRTKRAFEDTYEKLRVANQRKAQIEKDIKSQILKTHNVLKNVRSNMENEL